MGISGQTLNSNLPPPLNCGRDLQTELSSLAVANFTSQKFYNFRDGHQGVWGKGCAFPQGVTGFRCEPVEHRNPQSYLPVRNTQKGARSLAGQADCSAVTLEGGIPPSNIPHISEFLRNSEMFSYRHQACSRLRPGEMPPTSLLVKIGTSLLDKG